MGVPAQGDELVRVNKDDPINVLEHDPDWVDPDAASNFGRHIFLAAVKQYRPYVIDSLRDDVLPLFTAARRYEDRDDNDRLLAEPLERIASRTTRGVVRDFRDALHDWSRRWKLEFDCITADTLETVRLWEFDPEQVGHWVPHSPKTRAYGDDRIRLSMVRWPSVAPELTGLSGLADFAQSLIRQNAESPTSTAPQLPEYIKGLSNWAAWRRRVDRILDEYQTEVDADARRAGFVRASEGPVVHRAEFEKRVMWLARYQVPRLEPPEPESYDQIVGRRLSPDERSRMSRDVRDVARLIGLWPLRPPRQIGRAHV